MAVTTYLRRFLNRGDTSNAQDQATPYRSATPSVAASPISQDNAQTYGAPNASAGDMIHENNDFAETSSMDEKKMRVAADDRSTSSASMPEKDAIQDLATLEAQPGQSMSGSPMDLDLESPTLNRTAGFLKSFSNIVCIIIGTGCLQIPYSFAKAGWIGIIVVVASAIIGGYTSILTIKCLYYRPGHRLHSFPQVGYASFGRLGKWAAQFFAYLYSLGTTCLYIILAGQFIHDLVSTLGVTLSQKVWMVLVAIVMWIPVAILKQMSEAAILAILGLLASIVVIFICAIVSVLSPWDKMHPTEPPAGHDAAIGIGLPVALSSIVFSYSGAVVYPHVEANMKKPKQWAAVSYTAMIFCCCCYLLIGVTGYWAYGDQVVSPVLDSIPTGAPATIGKIMITIHVIIAAPIMMLSFFLEVEKLNNLTPERFGKKKEFIIRLIYRTIVVGCVCGISLAIPYFADFLSLISSISCVTMFAIIPIVCYLKLYGHKVAPWYEKIWMGIVLAIGMVACVWGSVDAIKALIKDASGGK